MLYWILAGKHDLITGCVSHVLPCESQCSYIKHRMNEPYQAISWDHNFQL